MPREMKELAKWPELQSVKLWQDALARMNRPYEQLQKSYEWIERIGNQKPRPDNAEEELGRAIDAVIDASQDLYAAINNLSESALGIEECVEKIIVTIKLKES